jgi:hypothetical protein
LSNLALALGYFVVNVLADSFGPAVAVFALEPKAVGLVEVEGTSAQGII